MNLQRNFSHGDWVKMIVRDSCTRADDTRCDVQSGAHLGGVKDTLPPAISVEGAMRRTVDRRMVAEANKQSLADMGDRIQARVPYPVPGALTIFRKCSPSSCGLPCFQPDGVGTSYDRSTGIIGVCQADDGYTCSDKPANCGQYTQGDLVEGLLSGCLPDTCGEKCKTVGGGVGLCQANGRTCSSSFSVCQDVEPTKESGRSSTTTSCACLPNRTGVWLEPASVLL